MSTRTRNRRAGQSYTARLRQRSAASRHRRSTPPWLTSPHGPALLALAAEVGHLGAALVEWPASTPRGVLHVLAAAALGLIAATVYFGPRRPGTTAGIVIGAALPTAWLIAALAGASPYQDYPLGIAVTVTALEATLAVISAVTVQLS